MAKWTLTRLVETAKYVATEAGEQLSGFITHMAEFAEVTTRCLRRGLTFIDNFDCDWKVVELKHLVATPISATKTVVGAFPVRAEGTTAIDSWAAYYDSAGRFTVKIGFVGAPSDARQVTVVLLF